MDLVNEFGGDDCDENEARKISTSIKGLTGADYPSSNYVSHAVSNFVNNSAKNVNNYPTPDAKKAFDQLRQSFTKAPILQHFNLEQFIRVETDASGYAISRVLSQLTSDSGQWNLVAYFLHKIFLAESQYKTHDGELLAIVEAFKTWKYYLEHCKYKVLVLTNHNNLCHFMNTKNRSFCQVRWA